MDELKEIEGSMRTNENGKLMIATKGAFDQFFKDNPGSSFTYKIVKVSHDSRKRLFAYYFAEVIPKIIKGFYEHGEILTKKEAVSTMLSISVIDKEDIYECNFFELKRHIQECIIFAAENLHIVIEEPI